MNQKSSAPPDRYAHSGGFRRVLLGLSGIFAAGLIYCYQAQPDRMAGLTVVPACIWPVVGLFSVLFFGGRRHKAFTLTVLALWVMFAYTSAEEVRVLLRRNKLPTPSWTAARDEDRLVTIATLNCNASGDAAAEVAEQKPDIVLLQQPPSREQVQTLTNDLFGAAGGFIWTPTAAIVAKGIVESKSADEASFFVHATVQLTSGRKVDAICVKLQQPAIRYDYWKGEYWKMYRDAELERLAKMKTLMQYVIALPVTTPLIVGGDFGASAEDGALERLRANMISTFAIAGHGWGNTLTNDYPLERVDQIWVNDKLLPEWCEAHKTVHSNHRMVACDASLYPDAAPASAAAPEIEQAPAGSEEAPK